MTVTPKPRLIRRRYFAVLSRYWHMVESHRDTSRNHEQLVPWAFDFVSIHRGDNHFSLISPLKLVADDGSRPRFEEKRFETFGDAKAYAMKLVQRLYRVSCGRHHYHVVNCG